MLKLIQVQWILLLSVIVSAERLPGNIVPLEYKLEILTNLGITDLVFDFTGYVVIHVS